MGNGEKAKMDELNTQKQHVLHHPTLQKNIAKTNGDTEIIRNFAPDGHNEVVQTFLTKIHFGV